ncbi:hypothetical protein T484DRAFT_1874618 [Baffinella frigidus]|nr:hypothetical protein T484DRAFT_1874618 [Cryptophyta sp. CCMP2293]
MKAAGGAAFPIGGALRAAAGLESLTDEHKEVILAGIEEVEAILDRGGLDSAKTTALSELLGKGGVDPAVAECFLGDGKWDPDQSQFQGAPVWDCVRTALGILKTTVCEQHLTGPAPRGGASRGAKSAMDEEMEDAGAEAKLPGPASPGVASREAKTAMDDGRTNCARSAPQVVGWDAILPKALENHFNQFCELELADKSVSDNGAKRELLEKIYNHHFVLNGGGCSRRRGGKASDHENSFHMTYHLDGRTCCDGANNLRSWMLRCLKGARVSIGVPSAKKRKPSVSGGGSPRKARKTADGGRAASSREGEEHGLGHPEAMQLEPPPVHTLPVLKAWEHLIEVPGRGDCMFEAAGTGIQANLGHARPVGEMLRLALANDVRAEAIKLETGDMREHFQREIMGTHLVVDGEGEFTDMHARAALDAHAEMMGKQGEYGKDLELMAIAAGNKLVINIIRGKARYPYQLEGQEIRNPPITLAFYGLHYDLVVDTRTEMGRRMADADQAEKAADLSDAHAIFASGAAARSIDEAEKAVCEVRERTVFVREVARASEFHKKPKIIEVGRNSLRAALEYQCRSRRFKLSSERMKMLQDAGATREAVSEWLDVKGNRSKAFSSFKAASATAWMKQSATAQSVQSRAGGADALHDLAAKLLESETFLGHAIHLFALAHLLGATIAILTCGRGGGAKKPWEIWNSPSSAEPGAKKPRLYLSRHGDNFASYSTGSKP